MQFLVSSDAEPGTSGSCDECHYRGAGNQTFSPTNVCRLGGENRIVIVTPVVWWKLIGKGLESVRPEFSLFLLGFG